MRAGIARRFAHSLAPLIGDRREARIKRGAQVADERGQRIVEIAILALAETMPRHDDMAAEMPLLRIERGDRLAFVAAQQLVENGAAIGVKLAAKRGPVVARNARPGWRGAGRGELHLRQRAHAACSLASSARLRSTPQR